MSKPPTPLVGTGYLKHASELYRAVVDNNEIQIWKEGRWTTLVTKNFSRPLHNYRVKPKRRVFWINFHPNGERPQVFINEQEAKNRTDNVLETIKVIEILEN